MRTSRRALLASPALAFGAIAGSDASTPVMTTDLAAPDLMPFEPALFGTVGLFDIDWLNTPEFGALLDMFAASPGAITGMRVFGAFTAGEPDAYTPATSGTVWTDPNGPIDFSVTFSALEQLTSRGMTPFVSLGFFPPAVSPSPVVPPASWDRWQDLVRAFFTQLAADPRFGAAAIAEWWFEVWNEPNEGRFWQGTPEQYSDLYRATSDAVSETGLAVRLGGPAIAYQPQRNSDDGAPWIERFLRFIATDESLRLGFISFHRKGTVGTDPPDLDRLRAASRETARLALAIIPERCDGLAIINDEADEKVGFEQPYAPRMDQAAPAWLCSAMVQQAALTKRFRDAGLRFISAADNANLQLVQAPFDGRRSLVTVGPKDRTDLIKLPVFAGYEVLRLLGAEAQRREGAESETAEASHRHTAFSSPRASARESGDGVYQLAMISEAGAAVLVAHCPEPGSVGPPPEVECRVAGVPWDTVNVAFFVIDGTHSNAYAAAGGSAADPYPVPRAADLPAIRMAAELAVGRPIARGVPIQDGVYAERLSITPNATLCLWITPVDATVPAAPAWMRIDPRETRTILRWEPCRAPRFYSYEVYRMDGGRPMERLGPDPLRAAMWVVDHPGTSATSYGVRVVSASGIAGPFAIR
jgi:xylan 1,4-beta-xylosidase